MQSEDERQALCDEAIALRAIMADQLHEAVADGVVHGLQRAVNSPEFVAQFWAAGYKQLAEHSTNNAAQWIGKRILTAAAILALTALLGYLIRSGAIK